MRFAHENQLARDDDSGGGGKWQLLTNPTSVRRARVWSEGRATIVMVIKNNEEQQITTSMVPGGTHRRRRGCCAPYLDSLPPANRTITDGF